MAMLDNRIVPAVKENLLDIMPDEYYFKTVRPTMYDIFATVKFDPILTDTMENLMNKGDSFAGNKQYDLLLEEFESVAKTLVSPASGYQKQDFFLKAPEAEKELVRKLGEQISDLITNIKCTKSVVVKEEKEVFSKQRLGYDPVKKENDL